MDSSRPAVARQRTVRSGIGGALAAALLVGCASTPQLDAQWSDPSLGPSFLRGTRVLVACDAYEVVVRQICQDHLAREVVARGATPVFLAPGFPVATDRSVDAQAAACRARGGREGDDGDDRRCRRPGRQSAVSDRHRRLRLRQQRQCRRRRLGAGRRRPRDSGYSANGRVTEVPSGRLVWTAKATAPPSSDINAQMSDLSRLVLGAADESGLF